MSKIVETVTPEMVPADRFTIRCRHCERADGSRYLDYARGVAEAHARATGHTVDITDEEAV